MQLKSSSTYDYCSKEDSKFLDMTYGQTIEFLFSQLPSYQRIGQAAYKNDLSNIIALDNYLGHPHRRFKTIHVAGTNGKGSVSHMIASVLQEAGYKTGLYTSPHLKDFRERIKINGMMIPEGDVVSFVERNIGIIRSLKPSFFEMTVGMAFDFFSRSGVDVAVIEVGLGGRLDSTNIITPVLSVITNIGHDHMNILGDSLEKIAVEKAGIIKDSVPVVISESQKETSDVFRYRAQETGSQISFADQNFTCVLEDNPTGVDRKFLVSDVIEGKNYNGLSVLGGDYQEKNIKAVFQVFKSLKGVLTFTIDNVINGIRRVVENTGLSGRWQIIGHDPLTICDTGHNREGLEYVMNQIKRIPRTGLHMIIGFVNDKDLTSVLPLFPVEARYYFTKASVPRALNEEILKNQALQFGLEGTCYTNVKDAMKAAAASASSTDIIFIGGSTFIVADAF